MVSLVWASTAHTECLRTGTSAEYLTLKEEKTIAYRFNYNRASAALPGRPEPPAPAAGPHAAHEPNEKGAREERRATAAPKGFVSPAARATSAEQGRARL